ncbi:MAG: translocation/assembly module TamB domain-containing protein [Verrucomicrobiales bacterium]
MPDNHSAPAAKKPPKPGSGSGPAAADGDAPAKKKRGCRGCFGRLCLLALLLGIPGGLWLNGPGFRMIGAYFLEREVKRIDLAVDPGFALTGTILGGPGIENLTATGGERADLKVLEVRRAQVAYDLFGDWSAPPLSLITEVEAEGVRVRIEPVKREPKPEKKPDDGGAAKRKRRRGPPKEIFALHGAKIALRDISVSGAAGGNEWAVDGVSLEMQPEAGGPLRIDRLLIPGGDEQRDISATVVMREDHAEVRDLNLLDDLRVARASADESTAEAKIHAFGADLDASYAFDTRAAEAKIAGGAFDLAKMAEALGLKACRPPSSSRSPPRARMSVPSRASLTGNVALSVRDLDLPGIAFARAEARAKIAGGTAQATAKVQTPRGTSASVDATATPDPENLGDWKSLRAEIQRLEVESPDLGEFAGGLRGVANAGISGRLEGGEVRDVRVKASGANVGYRGEVLAGSVAVEASAAELFALIRAFGVELNGIDAAPDAAGLQAAVTARGVAFRGETAGDVTVSAKGAGAEVIAVNVDADLPDENAVAVSGSVFPAQPIRYDATADVALPALAALQPLLDAAGAKVQLGGSANLAGNAAGTFTGIPDSWGAEASIADLAVNEAQPVSAELSAASPSAGVYEATLAVRSGELSGGAEVALGGARLSVEALRIAHAEAELASGSLAVPLDLQAVDSLQTFLAQDGEFHIDVQTEPLTAGQIFGLIGQEPPVAGTTQANVALRGTFAAPQGSARVELRGAALPGQSRYGSADADLTLAVADGRAQLAGEVRHPQLQPLSLNAEAPADLRAWALEPERLQDLPVAGSLALPRTSLQPVKDFVPALREIDGEAEIQIEVAGTAAQPAVDGWLRVAAPQIRFRERAVPSLRDIDIDLAFTPERVEVKSLKGEVAGGRFALGGEVRAPEMKWAEPEFAITLETREALIYRDESLNIRANGDLTLDGPWKAAAIGGKIGVTGSRFFRDIDILPLGRLLRPERGPKIPDGPGKLPRKDEVAAAEEAPPKPKATGVSAEPFAAWALNDVRVVTDDPFLVRSNLAEADITADLVVRGTLGEPQPDGAVSIASGAAATLPFSRLRLTRGELRFTPGTGFTNPYIDVEGRAFVREHVVNLTGSGSVNDPQLVLTSDTGLNSEDAMSLLATGATREELTSGSGTAAVKPPSFSSTT